MKLFFGLHDGGLGLESVYTKVLRGAIVSAKETNNFEIIVLYDGQSDDVRSSLTSLGATVIECTSPFADLYNNESIPKSWHTFARGGMLRLEIPKIVQNVLCSDDQYVMYCDVDVVFKKDITAEIEKIKPEYLAMATEEGPTYKTKDIRWKCFNSGVMVMNVQNYQRSYTDFFNWHSENLGADDTFDQEALNQYFKGKIDLLPPEFNWRPYWKKSHSVKIMHYHGIRPFMDLKDIKKAPKLKKLLRGSFYTEYVAWNNKLNVVNGLKTGVPDVFLKMIMTRIYLLFGDLKYCLKKPIKRIIWKCKLDVKI